jgi:hypothetical protein
LPPGSPPAAEYLPEPEIQEIGMRLRFTVHLEKPIAVEKPTQSGIESAQLTAQVGEFCKEAR